MIRIALPFHLRRMAGVEREVQLDVPAPVTMDAVLDVLEAEYPMLRGTVRDHATRQRRAFLRFFALQQDISLKPLDAPLPEAIAKGEEPLRIVGAMAGG
jgi:molybdopterin synthase sulfur carrier subunit